MDKIIYNLVFNRKKVLNQQGKALVQVEAYLKKRKKYFTTKVYLAPDQWDYKKRLVKNHPNKDALNRMLYDYLITIEKRELELWQQKRIVTLELLKDSFRQPDISSFTLFYKKEVKNSFLKENTKKNHLSTLQILTEYKKDIGFSELTFEFVSSFELFMKRKGYHINTIAKHMKHLKRYINVAINKEYVDIQKYAFRKYKIKTKDGKHTYLTPVELESLEQLAFNGSGFRWEKTLDAFLFCCYSGLRYSDFISLKAENIVAMNEEVWLVYKSVKTEVEVRIPLFLLFQGKCLKILEKYRSHPNELFQIKDNSTVNKELMKIARLAGIKKHFSFHSARHTNATLLIYKGANITTVQKLLGHRSIKTTQIYSDVMDMTLIRDLEHCKTK